MEFKPSGKTWHSSGLYIVKHCESLTSTDDNSELNCSCWLPLLFKPTRLLLASCMKGMAGRCEGQALSVAWLMRPTACCCCYCPCIHWLALHAYLLDVMQLGVKIVLLQAVVKGRFSG